MAKEEDKQDEKFDPTSEGEARLHLFGSGQAAGYADGQGDIW
jgi:hypothetical protein